MTMPKRTKRDNRQIVSIIGTAAVHALAIALLLMMHIRQPQRQEEEGVAVVMEGLSSSGGTHSPYAMTEVDIMEAAPAAPAEETAESLITQEEESTVSLPEERKAEEPSPQPQEKTEAEKRAEAEQAAAQQAAHDIMGAFSKGAQMKGQPQDTNPGGTGNANNATPGNELPGNGGYGSFDLQGRELGEEGLPRPAYNTQDEGRVVVTITVNPKGEVIGTQINKRTNTNNPLLRKAALDAARKARFNSIDGIENQTGTIIYYFKLK